MTKMELEASENDTSKGVFLLGLAIGLFAFFLDGILSLTVILSTTIFCSVVQIKLYKIKKLELDQEHEFKMLRERIE